jgi:uncharacterized LabA/DUF88 family protein
MDDRKRAIIYIDGFNLYSGLMDKGWGAYRWLDIGSLAEVIKPIGYEIDLIRYFTTMVKGDIDKNQRQQTYLNALNAYLEDRILYMFGRFQLFPTRCKFCGKIPICCDACGKEYKKPNEKKTDVNIATSMLVDCFENHTDAIILVSGDSDFETPLKEISRMFPHIYRLIVFPPKRKNPRLYGCCENHINLGKEEIKKARLLPDPVINRKTGKKYYKPKAW